MSLTTLGLTGLLGLSGCGSSAAAAVSDEATALQAVGVPAAAPTPSASAAPRGERGAKLRQYLRKNTLHGQVTVQGKDGARTIAVQRGAVTAVTSTGVSVKSTDGFTATWTFGPKVRIVQDRKKVAASALKTGAEIGVAGAATSAAGLILIN